MRNRKYLGFREDAFLVIIVGVIGWAIGFLAAYLLGAFDLLKA
jgi:hypothetical protein